MSNTSSPPAKRLIRSRWWIYASLTLVLLGGSTLLLGTAFYFLGPRIGARDAKDRVDFQALGQALQVYENLNGFLPTTEQGLDALVRPPTGEPKPSHWFQMLREIPKDRYGRSYVYACPGKHGTCRFDICSRGQDGVSNTGDDLGNWQFK